MRYKIYLVLLLVFWLGCPAAFSDVKRYRVELLVLRHLNGVSEQSPQTTLRDFSSALDLTPPPAAAGTEAESAPADAAPAVEEELPGDTMPGEEAGEQTPAEEVVEPITLVEAPGDKMQLAWQRLRLGSAFRPELYLSWEQATQDEFPFIRVHDQEVLIEDDPYAGLRQNAVQDGGEQVTVFSDTSTPIEGDNPPEEGEAALPAPTRFYRLDGTARFRRGRFLHLDLDIEYRKPLLSDDAAVNVHDPANPANEEATRPEAFLVHSLKQSRQVQILDMEYFDGPVIAVLALVTRVSAASDQDELEDQDAE